MIYTLTLNPSLDLMMSCDAFTPGKTNRADKEAIKAGGKGINVSLVLRNLGVQSTAIGLIAGFTGNEIERSIRETGIDTKMIHVSQGMSRINVKLKSDEETEINGIGPVVSKAELTQLNALLNTLVKGDILVLSGSLAKGIPDDIYTSILEAMQEKEVLCTVDTAGKKLLDTLAYHPFLIKPNRQEIEELFHTVITSQSELVMYGNQLKEAGSRNVIISLGKDGAVAFTEDGRQYFCPAPSGKAVNTVGAGDSVVAGFVKQYTETKDLKMAFCYGCACGSASAFSEDFAQKEKAEQLYEYTLSHCKEI